MSIIKNKFGTLDGKDVYEYILANENDFRVSILSFGGIIRSITYKGYDVVLGRDTMEEYKNNRGCFGSLIGRNSNRIEDARFTIGTTTYELCANNGRNNIHGGKVGFDAKVWDSAEQDGVESSVVLTLHSPDGEEGFPGNADVTVTYTVTSDNALRIHYEAVCDADTVVNLTNHTYFNLNGHASGTADNHLLQIDSSFYTPNSSECLPTGEILSVEGTAFDFTSPRTVANALSKKHPQTELFGGFDHNFVLNGTGFRKSAVVKGDISGITMEMYTDRPAVQLYTGNGIEKDRICKDGAVYAPHSGLCLETQAFPNNLKYSHFPTSILRKGEKYDTTTEFRFI